MYYNHKNRNHVFHIKHCSLMIIGWHNNKTSFLEYSLLQKGWSHSVLSSTLLSPSCKRSKTRLQSCMYSLRTGLSANIYSTSKASIFTTGWKNCEWIIQSIGSARNPVLIRTMCRNDVMIIWTILWEIINRIHGFLIDFLWEAFCSI